MFALLKKVANRLFFPPDLMLIRLEHAGERSNGLSRIGPRLRELPESPAAAPAELSTDTLSFGGLFIPRCPDLLLIRTTWF